MTWGLQLDKAPERAKVEWRSNEDIYSAWCTYVSKRGAKNTQRNLRTYVRVFIRTFKPLVTTLARDDIENFLQQIETKCARLMNGLKPQCMARMDLTTCPLLTQVAPYSSCPKYKPLDPSGTWSYVCAINRFYEWLREEGRVATNPCLPVMRDFASRHSALFDERRRKPNRRNLEVNEVKLLVQQSPLNHAIGYLLMAKCFLRIHEVLKLRVDPDHLNIDEGWIDIPSDWALGNKRKGNKRAILDSEAKRWLRRYLVWWEEHVQRDDVGRPKAEALLLTARGRSWGVAAQHNYNMALHTDAVRLGLMTGNEENRRDRVNSHCFRGFATTQARAKGASSSDVQIMRGDLAPGSLERYDDYLRRLPLLWQSYGPVLGV